VSLRAENYASEVRTIDLGVAADIQIRSDAGPRVVALSDRHGFEILANDVKVTFITSNYPLVDDVSTYWFGYYYDRDEERFNQVEEDSYSDGDSAIAYTWQAVPIAAGEVVTRSVIVKFGEYSLASIAIALQAPTITDELDPDAVVTVRGSTSGSGVRGNEIKLFAIPDGRSGDAVELAGGALRLGASFTADIPLSSLTLSPGKHIIQVCAVGQDGDVSPLSDEFEFTIKDLKEPDAAAKSESIGAVVGGSVGGGLALALAVGIAVFLIQRSHKRTDDEKLGSDYGEGGTGPV
jgi:hypothetical protein